MRQFFRPALMLFAFLSLLTGVLYPLAVTGIAQLIFPSQANGSLIKEGDKITGSSLIGQYFSDPRYFWGRPSATAGFPYTPFDALTLTGSAGSNLGPLSQTLRTEVHLRVEALKAADPGNLQAIPVDLVTASASGLDPDISVAAAQYQIARVAAARSLPAADVAALVDKYTQGRSFGILGEPRVNVLLLNLALDGLK